MGRKPEEWLKQADYDLDTAKCMLDAGRYFYAVFMCHLSIEKALKGVYQKKLGEMPPKVHNLVYLLNKTGTRPEESIGRFLVRLNEASVVTRYPEELAKLQKDFTEVVAKDILSMSEEALKWIRRQF
jgi:HEPN domain-containing protein